MILTGKTIGQLTQLTGITSDTLFPVELSGYTYHIPYSGFSDTYVTGFTYDDANTITLSQSNGQSSGVTLNTFTGLTINGGLSATSISADTYYNLPSFTGNTSGDCITDLFVSNVNSCSPLHIQPLNTGDVYIGENGGVNVGIGTNSPTRVLDSRGTFNLQPSTNTFLRFDAFKMEIQVNNSSNSLTLNDDNNGISRLFGTGGVTIKNTSTLASLEIGNNTIIRENNKIIFSRTDNFVFGWWDTSSYRFRIGGGGFSPVYSSTTETFEVVGTSKVTGNVGIGITGSTDSTSRLQIKGSDSSSSNYGLKVQNSGGTDNLVVRNDGYVQTGGSLKVLSSGLYPNLTFENSVGHTANIQMYNNELYFTTSGQQTVLNSIGLSLGTNAGATSKLQVRGIDATASNFALKVENSASTPLFYVRNDGNVGIGTASPSEKLDVSGKTKTTTLQVTSGASTAGYVLTDSDGTGNVTWSPVSGLTGSVKKYSETLTSPSGGTYTITHSLGTTDIQVSLWLVTTDDLTNAKVTSRQTNSVDVVFSTSPGEDVRVVIIG